MKIVDFFDRIYVINLPYRKDRLASVSKELRAAGMPFSPGKVELFAAIKPAEPAGFPDIGWRGCFLSHLEVLKQARKDGLKNVLIMEDDLLISRRFKSNQERLVDELLKSEWDFVYFGHIVDKIKNNDVKLISYSDKILTTHCYGVNGAVFDSLIQYLEAYLAQVALERPKVDIGIDSVISNFRIENKNINTLISMPALCIQSDSASDLFGHGGQVSGLNAVILKLPFGKYVLRALRAIKRFVCDI